MSALIITTPNGNNKGVNYPRSIVRIDGFETYFDNWTVDLYDTHQADTFQLYLPFLVADSAPETYMVATPSNPSYLFTKSDLLVEIFVGHPKDPNHFTTDDLTQIMYGYLDTVEVDLGDDGEQIVLTGRNFAAPLLDTKVAIKWQNMTSSAIAAMLAKQYGLKTKIWPTTRLAGTFYSGDNVYMNTSTTEWDLLAFLADNEGYILRVQNDTLYFGPFSEVIGVVDDPSLEYTWGQNVDTMYIQRAMHAAKNIAVFVQSYQTTKPKHRVKAQAKANKTNASTTYTEYYYIPGLTQDQAQQLANSKLATLSRMELIGNLTTSGDERLLLDHKIHIGGMGKGLDGPYYIQHAQHKFTQKNNPSYDATVDFSNLLLQDQFVGGL